MITTQRNLRTPLLNLKLAISVQASYAIAYVVPFALSRYGGQSGVLLGFPGSSGERRREDTPPYQ